MRGGLPALACLSLFAVACGDQERAEARAQAAQAVAALGAGDLAAAEDAAARAAARGGADFVHWRRFLEGNVAWARADLAEATFRAASDPRSTAARAALDRALLRLEAASSAWRDAAVTREDWPAARRNAERAFLRLRELRRARDELGAPEGAPPPPPPQAPDAAEPPPADGPPDLPPVTLSPKDLEDLFDRLRRVEREKQEQRAQRRAAPSGAERDW